MAVLFANLTMMATKKSKKVVSSLKATEPVVAIQQKKVGRPRAKHSDPAYKQMSVYVHQDVRNKVKMRLFETGGEFSGLVESLLRDWLKRV